MGETNNSLGSNYLYTSTSVQDSLNAGMPTDQAPQETTIPDPTDISGFNAYVNQVRFDEWQALSRGISQSSTPAKPQIASASPAQGNPTYELKISKNGVEFVPVAATLIGCHGDDKDTASVEMVTVYRDSDRDGYGDPSESIEVLASELADSTARMASTPARSYSDADGDTYVDDGTDCDDTDPLINTAAEEVCDEVDNDCDTKIDDADEDILTGDTEVTGAKTWYFDTDGDGDGGDTDPGIKACEQPTDQYTTSHKDCDDGDPYVNGNSGSDDIPPEICDGVDNDCDGDTDEGMDLATWYADVDGDGYGNSAVTIEACEEAFADDSGWVKVAGDCDDTDASVNPGATEVTENGVDDDCDVATSDEAAVATWSGDNNVSDYTIKLSGVSAKDYAGTLANGVDVDGDGYSDIMVGAYKYNAGNGYGNAYLVKGPITSSGTLSAKADASISGSTRDDYVGYDLAMTSDYDGSGTPFAAIAGSKYSTYGAVGLVDLTSASGSIAFSSSDLLINAESSYRYPNAVTMGDVTGDGYDQAILIGDAASDGYSSGAALLFNESLTSGSLNLSDADSIFYGTGKDQAGGKVALADVNGDGIDDVIVASISADGTAGCISLLSYECAGSVAVFTDSVSGSVSTEDATASIYGDLNSGNLGSALSAGTDLDGDGYGDLVLGAYTYNDSVSAGSGEGPGAVYLVLGASDMSTKVDTATDLATLTIYGNEEGDDGGTAEENKDVGTAVLAMEMTDPVLIYSVDAFGSGSDIDTKGEVRLLYYPVESSGIYYAYDEDSYDAIFRGSSSEWLGFTLANAGDTDADGYNDLLIGALRADSTTGASYLLSGTP